MKKKENHKQQKRSALLSFLDTNSQPTSEIVEQPKKNDEEQQQFYEQYVESNDSCNCCGQLTDIAKRKKCGFCNLDACTNHLRKRRVKKNKWERICDNCQDRILYETYSKLQSKAQEALLVEQEIITLKHQNFFQEVEGRRQKRKQIAFRTMSIQQKYEQQSKHWTTQENKLISIEHKVESEQLQINQLQSYIDRLEASFTQNCEEDHKIMKQENDKLAKQLTKMEKRCMQFRSTIQRKQKQIEEAYENWEKKQFKSKVQKEENMQKMKKKKQNCQIY